MILFAILAALHITAHVTPLSGDTGWDYITTDPAMHRVFVAHGDRITVIDSATHKEIGTVLANGAHGVALAPDLKRGFSSNGRGNDVTVFDYESLKPLASWKTTGENPDAILYDAGSKHLFTFNGRGKNATVFDATSGEVVGTIPMGGKPEFAQSDEKGHVYVNVEDRNETAEIDAKEAKVVRRWPLAGCESPSGLAIDRAHRRLMSVCENKIMAISDIETAKVVRRHDPHRPRRAHDRHRSEDPSPLPADGETHSAREAGRPAEDGPGHVRGHRAGGVSGPVRVAERGWWVARSRGHEREGARSPCETQSRE